MLTLAVSMFSHENRHMATSAWPWHLLSNTESDYLKCVFFNAHV